MTEAYEKEVNTLWVMQLVWTHQDDEGSVSTHVSASLCVEDKEVGEKGDGEDSDTRRGVEVSVGGGAVVAPMLFSERCCSFYSRVFSQY